MQNVIVKKEMKDKLLTECKPSTANFNYWCQDKYGPNFGYTEILKGRAGCCGKNNNMARAECSNAGHDGFNGMINPSDCIKK